jgi:hypothetical protein
MTWTALLVLALGAYLMKAAAPVLAAHAEPRPAVTQVLDVLAIPLLAALILVQTLDGGERRQPGVQDSASRRCWSGAGRRSSSWCSPRPGPRRCCGRCSASWPAQWPVEEKCM